MFGDRSYAAIYTQGDAAPLFDTLEIGTTYLGKKFNGSGTQ